MTKRFLSISIFVVLIYVLLDYLFTNLISSSSLSLFLSFKILQPLIFVFIPVYLIQKLKIDFELHKNYKYILPFCLLIIYLSFNDVEQTLSEANTNVTTYNNILFLLSCLCVGAFEELFFRVYVFQNFLNKLKSKSVITIILVSSMAFSIAHIFSAIKPEIYLLNVLAQAFMAFGLGFFFQTLYLKFKNIVLPICLHGIYNYYASYNSRLVNHDLVGISKFDMDRFLTNLGVISVLVVILLLISFSILKTMDLNSRNNY